MQPHSHTKQEAGMARFTLGQTFITPGAEEALEMAGQSATEFLPVTSPAIGENCQTMTLKKTNFHLSKGTGC